MKQLISFFLLAFIFVFSKAEDKDPYLVKTKNFHVNHFSLQQIDLGTTAVIYNPYKVKVNVDEILIDVFLHGKKLGTITEAAEVVKIKKVSAFDLPLNVDVKTGPTLSSLFAEGAKMALKGNKIGVNFKGYVKLKALGFVPVSVKIDQTEYFGMKDILHPDEKPKKIDTKDPALTKP